MITAPDSSTIDAVVRILRKSRSLLFIAGAGVSAESGIPTYRSIGGLYNLDTTEDGVVIEEALSASMLAENHQRFSLHSSSRLPGQVGGQRHCGNQS